MSRSRSARMRSASVESRRPPCSSAVAVPTMPAFCPRAMPALLPAPAKEGLPPSPAAPAYQQGHRTVRRREGSTLNPASTGGARGRTASVWKGTARLPAIAAIPLSAAAMPISLLASMMETRRASAGVIAPRTASGSTNRLCPRAQWARAPSLQITAGIEHGMVPMAGIRWVGCSLAPPRPGWQVDRLGATTGKRPRPACAQAPGDGVAPLPRHASRRKRARSMDSEDVANRGASPQQPAIHRVVAA